MAILFITSTHIGDAVLSTGALAWLLERYPDDEVTIACGAPAAKVFQAAPRIADIHIIRKQPWRRHWFELWRAVGLRRWRIVVDLRRSVMPWVVMAGKRHTLPRSRELVHRVELIARTLGQPPLAPVVWTAESHGRSADTLLGCAGDVLAIGPGATWIGKTWPCERFAELAARLTAAGGLLAGARVLVIGSEQERTAAQPLLDSVPPERLIDSLGVDVLTTHEALRRCRLMVGNDSAMMHLAAAAGCPTVGLFGPTRDEHYGPWGPNGLVVRTPESIEQLIGHADYDTKTTGTMMTGLTAEAVEAAIRHRWPHLPAVQGSSGAT